MFIGALARELNERAIGFLGGVEFSRLKLEPAVPEKPVGVFRIERDGFGIGLARGFGIAQPGDGTEVAIGNRRFLPILFGLARLLGMAVLSSATAFKSCVASAILFSFKRSRASFKRGWPSAAPCAIDWTAAPTACCAPGPAATGLFSSSILVNSRRSARPSGLVGHASGF